MKTRFVACVLSLISLLAFAPRALAQVAANVRERIQASYVLALGRAATEAEVVYWAKQNPTSVAQLVGLHQQYFPKDANTHRTTIIRAYNDAMGRNPTPAEIQHWIVGVDTYTGLMKNHVAWLGGNPAEYEAVIKRSYQFVFARQPTPDELRYWKGQSVLSYLMLISSHQTWKAANSNTAAKPTGQPTVSTSRASNLTTVSLSGPIKAEALSAAGLVSTNGGNVVAAGAGNVVAQGAGNVVSQGAGNILGNSASGVVAAGAGNVVAQGAGN